MKTKRVAKHALFTSVLALVLCVSMLVGTTFAWFTDSVTSGNNIIAAGNLDVELYNSIDTTGAKVNDQTALFDEITLWEPGVVAYENLTVANVGTLALKYELSVNFANAVATPEGKTLADVLKVAVIDGGVAEGLKRDEVVAKVSAADWKELKSFVQAGSLVADAAEGETSDTYAVVIYWQPGENDNDYNMNNGQTTELKIDLGVKLMATQLTHENDSFDNKYDEDSFYADANVATDEDLQNAIQDPSVETIAVHGSLVYDWGGDSYANSKSPHGKTFVGTDPATDSLTFKGYGSANAITNVTMRNITVHDETVGDDESSWEHGYLEFNGLTADNVVFDDSIMLDGTCQLTNCTVDNQIPSWYGVWIEGGSTTLRDCTFEGTRGMKICDKYAPEVGTVVVDGCTFDNLSEKPGVAIDDCDTQDMDITIKNSTFINCQPGDQSLYVYETDNTVPTVDNNKVLNGTKLAEGLYETSTRNYEVYSAEGLQYVFANVIPQNREQSQSVNLMNDIDLSGIIWEPIDNMHFTFNGNGHTISNVTCKEGWRSGFFSYAGGVTVNDLTLENVTASGSQVGIFAGSGEGFRANNCYLKGDNTVNYYETEETWGGIGAITGVISGSTVNVEICEGATVTLNKNGIVSQAAYYNDLTGYLTANNGTVVNNGTIIYGIGTAADFLALGGKSLSGTYALTSDINLGGAAAATIGAAYGKELTIIGNGHTLSNATTAHTAHNGMKHHGLFYAYTNSKLTISDLVIENVNIDSTADTERNYGAAIVVAFADGGSTVTLNNVDVNDCKVLNNRADIGDEAGVYVGYQTGTLVMTDCDSTGCTVAGETTEKTGAMIGMVDGTATLTNCTTDLTIGTCNRVSGTLVEQ